MIDIANGNIQIQNKNQILRKGLSKDEFICSVLFSDLLTKDEYGYTCFRMKPQLICEEKFIVVLYFEPSGILEMIQLYILEDDILPTWENWSEKEQLQKKALHDKWLEDNIGKPPYNYSWGTIFSYYDPRSASSSITFTYKK